MPKTVPETFATRLVQLMRERKLSQIRIARLAGCSQAAVSLWLRGTVPSSKKLELLATHLDLDEHWLLTGQGSKELKLGARIARRNAEGVRKEVVHRHMGELHRQNRRITVEDPTTGLEGVYVFDTATDEQWALLTAQIEASHHFIVRAERRSHPTS